MAHALFIVALFALIIISPAAGAQAQAPRLRLPVNCEIGKDCWIVNYVDVDPSGNSHDFTCGPRSYDGHHGTDFGIRDIVKMEQGVDVLAAENGTVLRIRDGVDDKIVTAKEREDLLANDKGCGNGVVITHGTGWQSVYCHMKKGSIRVKSNTPVKAGDKIGEIGLSGIAEFPHLHFGLFFEGNTIDPFTGGDETLGCGVEKAGLWTEEATPSYNAVEIYAAGFKAGIPDFDAIKIDSSSPEVIAANAEILTFWAGIYGAAQGDLIDIEIRDSLGRIFATRTIEQDKSRARQFYYVGRKIRDVALPSGTLTGYIKLSRQQPDGQTMQKEFIRTIEIR